LAKNNARGEVRLLPPRRVALSAAQYEEAVSLLAELLLEVAAKRRAAGSGGVTGGACGGVIGGVTSLPQKGREGREAA
jgi:hypothetical protein